MKISFDDHYRLASELAKIFSDQYNRQITRNFDETKRGFVNELQKAFSYLRWSKDVKKMLDLSLKRSNNQRFSQTKNTSDYYKVIHKSILTFQKQHSDLDYRSMLYIIGWAIRITSYEFKVSGDSRSYSTSHSKPSSSAPHCAPRAPSSPPRASSETPPPSEPQPAARSPSPPSPAPPAPFVNVPQPGEVFTDTVLEVGDDAVLVRVRNFNPKRVIGVMRAEMIPDRNTARYAKGNTARVEVVEVQQKDGRTILELKPAPKKK